MSLDSGSSFGQYEITGPVGSGGMASVYRAYEPALDRHVALKVLTGSLLHDSTFAQRFRREAKVIAKLEHRHIIPIYAFGIDEGTPWMAMRLIGGGTLASLLKPGRIERSRAVDILNEVAEALDYAHARGVLHRDVKPQNILLDEQGHVYLADFGIARLAEGATVVTRAGMITGTPQYMAPEQAKGEKLDRRCDVYSLGVVAYEMLAGRVPFRGDTPVSVLMKHLSDPIPLPLESDVPQPLMSPVLRSLAKKPADRWESATAFAKAVERAVAQERAAASTTTPAAERAPREPERDATPRPEQRLHWYLLAGILAAAGALVLGVALFVALRDDRPENPREAALILPASTTVPAPTPEPTATPSPESEPTPEPTAEVTPEQQPSPTLDPAESASPSPESSLEATPGPTPEPTPEPTPTPTPDPTPVPGPRAGESRTNLRDGQAYVWIPPGTFEMGCVPRDSGCSRTEGPQHSLALSRGFWLGRTEVTVAAYGRYAGTSGQKMPPAPAFNPGWGLEDHPIVNVSWKEASAYCAWAGGRLPTEAEWERAARGGRDGLAYPWGNGISHEQANHEGTGDRDRWEHTSPVASFEANGYGLLDVSGNVWEWCADWYSEDYYASSPSTDPRGPSSGRYRVLRGGSWDFNPGNLRASFRFRFAPTARVYDSGFRCACDSVGP